MTSQLASTTRGAIGLAGEVVGVGFLLSGVGNMLGTGDEAALRVTSAWPAWLSPIGWGQQMRPFGGDHWWPLALFALLFGCLLTVAVSLVGRRDVGRGLWPERRGDARARSSLLSPTGLVWRMQRGALRGWALGVLGFGLIFGALSEQMQDVSGSAREYHIQMGGAGQIIDAYQASMFVMAGNSAAIYVVQMLLRMRVDESEGTLEALLATGITRTGWIVGHVVNAAAGAVILVLVFAVNKGVTTGQTLGHLTAQVRDLTAAGLVQLPAVLVLGGAVIAVVGLMPRRSAPVSWALLLIAVLLGPLFATSLDLPQWVKDLSPFTHVPKAPAETVAATPLLLLVGACMALAVIGVVAVRRRNLVLPA